MDLNNEIKDSGLFLPMDPSPTVCLCPLFILLPLLRCFQALIGGMVATNCR